MKSLFKTLFLMIITNHVVIGQLSFTPEKPQQGEIIVFYYDAKNSKLSNEEIVKCEAFFFENERKRELSSVPIVLTKENNAWKGMVEIKKDNGMGVMLVFKSNTSKVVDDNMGKGYHVFAHNKQGAPLLGAYAGLSLCLDLIKNYVPNFHADRQYKASLFEKEFSQNSDIKSKYFYPYIKAMVESNSEEYKTKAKQELGNYISTLGEPQMSEMMLFETFYRELGEKEKANFYAKKIKEIEPMGVFTEMEYFRSITDEYDIDQRIKNFAAFEKNMPNSSFLVISASQIATDYVIKGDTASVTKIVNKYLKKLSSRQLVGLYEKIARTMTETDIDINLAEKYSLKALQILKTVPLTEDIVRKCKLTHGIILEKQKKHIASWEYLKEAIDYDNPKNSNPIANEYYVLTSLKLDKKDEAKSKGETFVNAGTGTTKIKDALGKLYIDTNGKNGVENYIIALEKSIKANRKENIKASMISEIAPMFQLKDLKGKDVNLNDFKGKIIILDFWALWCGPCVQSFAGMKRIQDKYKDNDKVKFLFVNVWERGKNVVPRIEDFLIKKKYDDFKVLIDPENKTIADYKIRAIPSKFVIDENGFLRYKNTGFEGNIEELEDEIDNIISLLAEKHN